MEDMRECMAFEEENWNNTANWIQYEEMYHRMPIVTIAVTKFSYFILRILTWLRLR